MSFLPPIDTSSCHLDTAPPLTDRLKELDLPAPTVINISEIVANALNLHRRIFDQLNETLRSSHYRLKVQNDVDSELSEFVEETFCFSAVGSRNEIREDYEYQERILSEMETSQRAALDRYDEFLITVFNSYASLHPLSKKSPPSPISLFYQIDSSPSFCLDIASYYLEYGELDRALYFLEKGYPYCQSQDLKTEFLLLRGKAYLIDEDLQEMNLVFFQACDDANTPEDAAIICLKIARVFLEFSDLRGEENWSLRALEYLEKAPYSPLISTVYNKLAQLYESIGNIDQRDHYRQLSYQVSPIVYVGDEIFHHNPTFESRASE